MPLTLDLAAHARLTGDREAADYALVVHNRHRAAADNVAAAQVRLGRLVDQRATPAEVKPGDQMYLDASPQHSPPHQVPYKLANRWMGPFVAKEVRGPSVRLDLPPELGKISLLSSLSSEMQISRIYWGQLNLSEVVMGCYGMRSSVFGGIDLRSSYLPRSI